MQLWKAFFEASAGIRTGPGGELLDEEDDEEEENLLERDGQQYEQPEDADLTAKETYEYSNEEEGDATAILDKANITSNTANDARRVPPSATVKTTSNDSDNILEEFKLPPRKHGDGNSHQPSWADDASPFEQLRNDMQKVRVDASYSTSTSYQAPPFAPSVSSKKQQEAQQHQQKQQRAHQTRLRDLSMDSPDFERPALQTMSFQHPKERLTQQFNQAPLPQKSVAEQSYQDYQNHIHNPSNFFDGNETSSAGPSNTMPDTPAGMSTLSDLSSLGGPSGGEERPNMPRRKSSTNQNALLQKVLLKNLVGKDGKPNLSTPAAKRSTKSAGKIAARMGSEEEPFYPQDIPKGWNGLADLSKTPLTSFDSPQKSAATAANRNQRSVSRKSTHKSPRTAETKLTVPASASSDSLFDNSIFRDLSLPSTSATSEQYKPPPFSVYKSRLSRTPAKDAARLIARDVLQKASLRDGGSWQDADAESPVLDPPSVVKNWATRGYIPNSPAHLSATKAEKSAAADRSVQGHQRSQLLVPPEEGEDSFEAEFDDGDDIVPPPQPNFGHLADDGDEIANSGAAHQSANVDDWGDSFEGNSADDDDNSGFDHGDEEVPLNDDRVGGGEDSFSDNSRSLDDETLFGAKRDRNSDAGQGGFGLHPEDALGTLDPNSRQAQLFRLQSQNDMVTLHGGNLLESQPFEASPLAGRDARYGL